MVEVNRVGLEDVVAVGRSGVNIFVYFTGVEWRSVVVADGEGDRVGGWWLESHSPAHQVLGEGVLGVGAEVKTSST